MRGVRMPTAAPSSHSEGADCLCRAGEIAYPGKKCLASQRPQLAAQWHPTKNGGRTPADVPLGSHYKAWWICEKGHEWQAMVKSRALDGTACPVCANRRLISGENDLAATHPELAQQWHPCKNGALTPHDVVAGTRKKVWWRCGQGHEWQASVSSRAGAGAGCPICAGKVVIPGENDLASHFPAVAAQWHPAKNGTLTPEGVSPYSNKKVWWQCPLRHEYAAAVAARTVSGSGCPYCAGRKVLTGFNDLATLNPQLARQWHPALNGALTPEEVTPGSHRKIWWECPSGHIWQAVVYSRAGPQKCGCPVCARPGKPERLARYQQALADADHAVPYNTALRTKREKNKTGGNQA